MSSAGATKATSSRHPRKSGYFITINQLPRLQTLQAINHSHRKVRKLRPIPRAHLQDGSLKTSDCSEVLQVLEPIPRGARNYGICAVTFYETDCIASPLFRLGAMTRAQWC